MTATLPYLLKVTQFTTLVAILRDRALQEFDKTAFIFLQDGETKAFQLTYGELDQQARAIAALLQRQKATGKRALLLYTPGLEFISAFFGCLYAGVIAVPAYPPRPNQRLTQLQAIAADAQATIALTTTSVLSTIERRFTQEPELAALRCLATDKVASNWAEDWQEPTLSSNTLAFLQYTSGSTSAPKGVMVSHGNLMYNSECIKQAFELTPDSVSVTWLPSFHDMGLIDGIIQPLYTGFTGLLMPPVSFVQRPIRWLQAISRYKATHCGGPNFAYDLCIHKVTPQQRETLDLSSWRTAYSGSEPVRQETLERFAQTFKPCGFRTKFLYACYGLAEATLMVSGGLACDKPIICTVEADALEQNRVVEADVGFEHVKHLVGSGKAMLDTKIAIAHPETLTRCSGDQVGEIWVSGSSVAQGYWSRPEDTDSTFRAYLADTGEGPFLRTGDLGFLKDGELFVTGRIKDMIVIRGRNHYPQDIELTVEQSHPSLRPSSGAAFSVEVDGVERLVVAQEVERTYLRKLDVASVVRAIRQAVREQHELQVYAIILLKTATIPKTSSGKIQRHVCRKDFLTGSLSVVGDWALNLQTQGNCKHLLSGIENLEQQLSFLPPRLQNLKQQAISEKEFYKAEAIQAWLISHLADHLKVRLDDIDPREPIAQYGMDSSTAVSLTGELADWLSRRLEPTLFWEYPSIEVLAQYLEIECGAKNSATP
jgi:acyl-CoA synthetase (AMP-forming)/AMP-acid ligase II/acyl carrier protein